MEDLSELKELCEEYEIPSNVFNKIVEEALKFREFEGETLDNNDLLELIKLSVENYDSFVTKTMDRDIHKTIEKTVSLSAHKLFDKSPYVGSTIDYDYSEENKHI